MRRVIVSRRAERDLFDILTYIAKDSPIQAERMVERLERAILDLSDAADRFQRLDYPGPRELRRRTVESYNIVYAVTAERVDVVLVAHGRMDLERLLRFV
jgi:plasmid stabilization system protein ParE